MAQETELEVLLLAHTKLSDQFAARLIEEAMPLSRLSQIPEGQIIAMTAIRTCYTSLKPSEVFIKECDKYFGPDKDINRLVNHISSSGHTSTLEHLNFTFAVEGISIAALKQLTRHRHASYSVQSQRYVKLSRGSKSGGFKYRIARRIKNRPEATELYTAAMDKLQDLYDALVELGIPPEDARDLLTNSVTTNMVVTMNLRSILELYYKRKPGHGAQEEITTLVEWFRHRVEEVEPWTRILFDKRTYAELLREINRLEERIVELEKERAGEA